MKKERINIRNRDIKFFYTYTPWFPQLFLSNCPSCFLILYCIGETHSHLFVFESYGTFVFAFPQLHDDTQFIVKQIHLTVLLVAHAYWRYKAGIFRLKFEAYRANVLENNKHLVDHPLAIILNAQSIT